MEQEDRWTCPCGAILLTKYPPLCTRCLEDEEKHNPHTNEEQKAEIGE